MPFNAKTTFKPAGMTGNCQNVTVYHPGMDNEPGVYEEWTFALPEGKTWDEFTNDVEKYKNGALIQEAFPYLNDDQREFIMSGLTPEKWLRIMKQLCPEEFPEE